MNAYAPNLGADGLAFLDVLRDELQKYGSEPLIIGGDWNCWNH